MRLWDSSSGRLAAADFDEIADSEDGGCNGAADLDRKSSLAVADAGLRSVVFCPEGDDIRVFDLYTGLDLSADECLKVRRLVRRSVCPGFSSFS